MKGYKRYYNAMDIDVIEYSNKGNGSLWESPVKKVIKRMIYSGIYFDKCIYKNIERIVRTYGPGIPKVSDRFIYVLVD